MNISLFIKKIFFAATFNLCLFFLLIIGIQNSSKESKVNFLMTETIKLPISFVVGSSFIFGSILGSFLTLNKNNKE